MYDNSNGYQQPMMQPMGMNGGMGGMGGLPGMGGMQSMGGMDMAGMNVRSFFVSTCVARA